MEVGSEATAPQLAYRPRPLHESDIRRQEGAIARPHSGRYRGPAPERTPPFLLVPDGGGLVLVTPFPKKRIGLTPEQRAIVQDVGSRLRTLSAPRGSVWIDPNDGRVTPAAIGEGQLRRRLFDCACFSVRSA